MAHVHLDFASVTGTRAQPDLHPFGGAISGAALGKGVPEALDVAGVEDVRVVLADDTLAAVAQKIVDLAVGEGEPAFTVEDVDEVGAALHESTIAGL